MSTAFANRPVRKSSDLSKHSAEVFAAAEREPISISRRDGESMVLLTESAAAEQEALLDVAAHLLAAITTVEGPVEAQLAHAFPWMHALSPAHQAECAHQLLHLAQAALSTGKSTRFFIELESWRESAMAISAGWDKAETEWLQTPAPVGKP